MRKLVMSASVVAVLWGIAAAGPSQEWSSSLVIDPQCAIQCPVRELGRARVSVKPTLHAGDGGLVARVTVSGAVKEPGSPGGDVLTLRLRLSLALGGGLCQDYVGPSMPVKRGRLSLTVTGAELLPAFPAGRGIVQVCAVALDDGVATGIAPVLVDGMVFANLD
jgi:hypothetical protein